jgi:hypothetical protein
MENDDQILQEMERDALRLEQEKAELAMFNIIEATNELKRIGAEGSVPMLKIHNDIMSHFNAAFDREIKR